MAAAPSTPMAALHPTVVLQEVEEGAAPQPGTPPPRPPPTPTTLSPPEPPLTNPLTGAPLLHPTLPPKTRDLTMRLHRARILRRRRRRRHTRVMGSLAVRPRRREGRRPPNSVGMRRRRLVGSRRRRAGGVKRTMNPGTKKERPVLKGRRGGGEAEISRGNSTTRICRREVVR